MLMHVAREFMRGMAQPYDRMQVGKSLLTEEQANAMDVSKLWPGSPLCYLHEARGPSGRFDPSGHEIMDLREFQTFFCGVVPWAFLGWGAFWVSGFDFDTDSGLKLGGSKAFKVLTNVRKHGEGGWGLKPRWRSKAEGFVIFPASRSFITGPAGCKNLNPKPARHPIHLITTFLPYMLALRPYQIFTCPLLITLSSPEVYHGHVTHLITIDIMVSLTM